MGGLMDDWKKQGRVLFASTIIQLSQNPFIRLLKSVFIRG
jgi:hypothetical protein